MRGTRGPRGQATVLDALRMGSRGGDDVRAGLVKLVLTVVEVVRQVLERQALRRMDDGDLTSDEVERLGAAFIEIRKALFEISREFGIKPEELTAQLGSIVRTGERRLDNASVADLLDRLLDRGAVLAGTVKLSVSDIDLVALDLLAMLHPIRRTLRPNGRMGGG